MNINTVIASATLLAAMILNLHPTHLNMSWNQNRGRRRALAIVVLVCSACLLAAAYDAQEKIAQQIVWHTVWNTIWPVVYTMISAAAWLLMRHLETQKSVWSSGRVLGLTRIMAMFLTIGLCWSCRQYASVLGALSLLSGVFYALLLRAEHAELSKIFRDLQTKLETLEANQRGLRAPHQSSKTGDNQRRAG
jgi:drug/metabolite transporter (DMT)-like permease